MTLEVDASFRNAMRRLTTTVNVITTIHEGQWCGMTATAVTSVCADPPAILACINGSAGIFDPLIKSRRFCVNLLRVGQEAISSAFAGQVAGAVRFDTGSWRIGECGLPYLEDAQANVFCQSESATTHGTHGIFIGRVIDVRLKTEIEPLLYQDGRYARSQYL